MPVALLFSLTACKSTEMVSSYKAPEVENKTYDNIMVAGLTGKYIPREVIENELVEALRKKNINADHSLNILPDDKSMDAESVRDNVLERIDGKGYDAYLTVVMIDKESETTYVPGSTYNPVGTYPYYRNMWGYYHHRYAMVYDPGYYTEEDFYYLEANLYDAETENLIWSGQTETYEPLSMQELSDEFAGVIANELKSENLLGSGK